MVRALQPGLLFLALIFLGVSCAEVTYRADNGFLNSAQAGAYEYPLLVQGGLCRDMDGEVGACVKRLPDNVALQMTIRSQPYAFRAQLTCSSELGADDSRDVSQGQDLTLEVPAAKYGTLRSFTCRVEVFPKDRPAEISAQAEVRVKLYDHTYVGRESMSVQERDGKSYLYMGDHAKYAKVCVGAVCRRYQETTVLEVPRGPSIFAYSESERMRFNYFNLR